MEARLPRSAFASVAIILAGAMLASAAGFRSPNFIVDAETPELATEIGQWAEKFRRDLAIEWLGKEMRPWAQPCLVTAQVAPTLGAGGATSFVFEGGEVHGWRMTIQGSRERLLDSVLPHEVTHTVFASHFRRALPRWADEGACTTVEHSSERMKQQQMLITFLKTGRGISFTQMFAMKEYPQDVMPLYSQGYSLARYLIAQGGKQKYLAFVATGMEREDWPAAVRRHYGHESLLALQNQWLEWVRLGSQPLAPSAAPVELASSGERRPRPMSNLIYRAQSEDRDTKNADEPRLVPVRPAALSPATLTASTPPASQYQQMAGTQPIEKPRQSILEWDRRTGERAAP
jgi:hypothetical protein